jgi:esterase/lipase superfamily enzyme
MPNATVYFASNRQLTGAATDWQSYNAEILPPTDATGITYAAALVDGVDLGVENSGAITAIENVQQGGFDSEVVADILGSQKNLLVFIPGFANSFKDGITRAAFNREWFAASGVAAADTTVVAFSWPSLGQAVAAPPYLLPDDYLRDQTQAGHSAFHAAAFIAALQPLVAQLRGAGRRCFLLAHSMGDFVLQGAVASWFAHGYPAGMLFDEALLPAADERWDSFAMPGGARLSRLPDLVGRISIYFSLRDIAMYLSFAVNLITRLGHEGPEHRSDTTLFPPPRYRILDCAEVDDYDLFIPADASHQYYRRSAKVRDDIVAAMSGAALPGGVIRL